ncbi:hypothetical protein FRC12_001728 [Ceratobasidium sp. 428]|nr:hypothetical protein FRC12_001728 [Ceratobasidium sp. 428]
MVQLLVALNDNPQEMNNVGPRPEVIEAPNQGATSYPRSGGSFWRRWNHITSLLVECVKDTAQHGLRRALNCCRNPRSTFVWIAISGGSSATWLANTGIKPQYICLMPIISHQLLSCQSHDVFWPDFPGLVELQSHLYGAMERSTDTVVVAIDLKRSEVAVRDLITRVKLSSLASKNPLVRNLGEFVEDARIIGRSLQRFGSRVGSVVDQTITTNEYAIGLLESAAKPKESLSWPRLLSAPAPQFQHKEVKATWFKAIEKMKSTVMELSVEAAANMRALDRLDEQLSVIHEIITMDDAKSKRISKKY